MRLDEMRFDCHSRDPGELGLEALFRPKAIAVAGVSATGIGQGNSFIRCLRTAGYTGSIYPIHPTETTLEGLEAYPSLGALPEQVDYAFVAIPAAAVPPMLASAEGRVRFAQVMSSGFGEGANGVDLQAALLEAARQGGMRLLGPNCMGTHSPRGRVSFINEGVDEPGCVGVLSQSGGLSIDMLRSGRYRGLRFSGLVSLGNCLDLGPCDLLEHFLADLHTRVIGAYLEDIREGRRFFDLLKAGGAAKPVVILKGGRTTQGQRAAASHTGSMASSDHIWRGLARQTGSILVDTLAQFMDVLATLQAETPERAPATGRVILFGNGGGASVLATDAMARLGVDVPPLQPATTKALASLRVPAGASLGNPIDVPANVLQRERGALASRIIETVAATEEADALVMHLNLPVIVGYEHVDLLGDLMDVAIRLREKLPPSRRLFLVLRSTGQAELEGRRQAAATRAMQAGIPVFRELTDAAQALAALGARSRFFRRREAASPAQVRA